MNFDFSGISKTNLETSVEYLQRHILNHPACFFFLEQTIDRQIDPLFLFPNNLLVGNLKVFILTK